MAKHRKPEVVGNQIGVTFSPSGASGSRETFSSDMRQISRILKSTINDSQGYAISEKEDGQAIFADASASRNVIKALNYAHGNLPDFDKINADFQKYVTLRSQIKMQGKKARQFIASMPKSVISDVQDNGDSASVDYRVDAGTFSRYQQEHEDYKKAKSAGQKWTGDKNARYSAEVRAEKEILGEAIGVAKSENKEIDATTKKELLDKYSKKFTLRGASYASLVDATGLSASELKEKFKGIEQKDAKERNDKRIKAQEASERRKTLAFTTKIVGTVTVLTDLTRRILTQVMNIASQSRATAVQASTMGMSYIDMQKYNMADTFMGLKKGTHGNALSDIQNKFGDITNLDEKAIGVLARVMGNGVTNLVTSGLGRDNPDELLTQIMNSYFESFKQGKNSLGQNVGREQALRELTTSLREVSPAFAEIFSTMAHDYTTGARAGSFSNYKEYLAQVQYNRGGLTETEMSNVISLASVVNQAKMAFEGITSTLNTKVANAFADFISRISDTRIGESAKEKMKHNMTNREKLQLSADVDRKVLEKNRLTFGANLSDYGEEFAGLTLDDVSKYYLADVNSLEGDEAKKAQAVHNLIARASLSSDQTMFSAIGQFISTSSRLRSSEAQLGRTSGEIDYLAGEHTDEGKAMAVRDVLLELRKNKFVNEAGVFSGGTDIESQIKMAKGRSKVVDVNKLSKETRSLISSALQSYYEEYGKDKDGAVDRLFNYDEEGNAILSSRRGGKDRKGRYNDPLLVKMAQAFNQTTPEYNFGTVKNSLDEEQLKSFTSLLSTAEKAKNRYTKDGVLDEEAFSKDKDYSLYRKLKEAELASFADIYVNGGLGNKGELSKSFEKAISRQQDELQKQAELMATNNMSMDKINSNVDSIHELLDKYVNRDYSGVYEISHFKQGETKVNVEVVVRDREGRTIEKRLETRTLSSGAEETKITSSKVGDGKIMMSIN